MKAENTGGAAKTEEHRWEKMLHRSYFRGSQGSHFIFGRITPAGWGLMGATVLVGFFSSDISRSDNYWLFGILSGLLMFSLLWVWLRRGNVVIERTLPRYAMAKCPLIYEVEVQSLHRFEMKQVSLMERQPDLRPSLERFVREREPWEMQRNGFDRRFAFYRWRWLMERSALIEERENSSRVSLKPGEKTKLTCRLLPQRRGVLHLKDMRLCLLDPLGFFRRLRRVKCAADKVIVLPRSYRLNERVWQGLGLTFHGGESCSNQVGQSSDYHSLREYRQGDPLRHLHWKAWARTGKPVVLEFEEVFYPRFGLFLDTECSPLASELFEDCVSVAASFVDSMNEQTSLLELIFMGEKVVRRQAGRGEARPELLLEELVGVEAQSSINWPQLAVTMLKHASSYQRLFFITAAWNREKAGLIAKLQRQGVDVSLWLLARDRVQALAQLQETPVASTYKIIQSSSIQEDLLHA